MASDVSVLIPAHGPSPYIKFTLESILNNTIQPAEVLIIDDGLGKEALAEIDVFQSLLPISVITNEGEGLVDALNTGLRAAKFKYIARIDNDDLMASNRIERQIAQFNSDALLVAVGSQCFYINSEGTRTGKSNYFEGTLNGLADFKYRCLIAHPSSMYLRNSALAIGGYRSLFKWDGVDIAEDFDFWLRLSGHGTIAVSADFLTEYRQHREQLSSQRFIGVLIGTPYISAVNLASHIEPIMVRFDQGKSSQLSILLVTIKRNLGLKAYLACRLSIIQFRKNKIISSAISQRIINKIARLLQL